MIARRTTRSTLAAMFVVALSSACARDNAPPAATKEFELGAHRVQVTVPAGWDALDQGKQKRFRRGEAEIVLQDLGKVDWEPALASLHDDRRREVKSRRPRTIDNHEAMEIETWNRLDHTNPQRIFFVKDDGDLLALHTVGMAFQDSLAAFDAIRDSLHFAKSGSP
jgi:hypothetical protein